MTELSQVQKGSQLLQAYEVATNDISCVAIISLYLRSDAKGMLFAGTCS